MPDSQPVPWSELAPAMQTGDLILFAGSSEESKWIERLTTGRFSHAAMIFRPDPGQPPLMWQEAPDGIVDDPQYDPPLHGGAQLGDALGATEVIANVYLDVPYYVKLNWERPANVNQVMQDLISTYEARPFGTVVQMGLNYVLGHWYDQGTEKTAIFCAELVALTLQAVGALGLTHPANWYSPNSFDPEGTASLPWLGGASLSTPVEITVPSSVPLASLTKANWPAAAPAPDEVELLVTLLWNLLPEIR